MGQYNKAIDIRKQYKIPLDNKLILYVGRLSEQKGVIELIKAFKMLKRKKTTLLVVGSAMFNTDIHNEYEKSLAIEASGIDVIFTGHVMNSLLTSYYKSADVAVFPSLRDEAAGMTILEAITCKVPVITTNIGGIPEYVNGNVVTILDVNDDIIESLSENLTYILDNDVWAKQRALKAYELSLSYSSKIYYEDFINIINEISCSEC
jgi:glycosyltransferase involved in cell wall biosynthesis